MLKLILGKAGSGKTTAVMSELRDAVVVGLPDRYLIVPEQYSHEAERELARVCGDTASRYAEVYSFTTFAREITGLVGGGALPRLDNGGRLLCLALALNAVAGRLSLYGGSCRKPEMQSLLLSAIDECKAACVSAEMLEAAAAQSSGSLQAKLRDFSLILAAYDSVVSASENMDPTDLLGFAAEKVAVTPFGPHCHVYVDGFTDFTAQEENILFALLKKGVELTVCLTVDSLQRGSELFGPTRRSALRLLRFAEQSGIRSTETQVCAKGGKSAAVRHLAEYMLGYAREPFSGDSTCVRLHAAGGMIAECEHAAATAISLVRDTGCRWRDIAVAVRGFDDYRSSLESIFRFYGVPLFVASKDDLLTKPLPAMISGLFDIVVRRWSVDDVITFMRTGLTGLTIEECDLLETYIHKWQISARSWESDLDWAQPPEGLSKKPGSDTPEAQLAREEKLAAINLIRRKLADPIRKYERSARIGGTAREQAQALSDYFSDIRLAAQLSARSEQLRGAGRAALADEYRQLWEIVVNALEQFAAILGDAPMNTADFGKFFTLMLSKYNVGTIPVSLDSVSAGDFDRMRRRSIRHLIVLGADDARLPRSSENSSLFSSDEKRTLSAFGIELGGADEESWREFMLIYNCISLPAETIGLCYSTVSESGSAQHPSFIIGRAQDLFRISAVPVNLDAARSAAKGPALNLAAHAAYRTSPACAAAARYFETYEPERLSALKDAAMFRRGSLSPQISSRLYGAEPRLSASRIEKFIECPFAYFVNNGLKAEPYEPAELRATDIGTFTHDILEHTVREVESLGGFRAVEDDAVISICDKYIEEYIHRELNDFKEKSERFIYLFRRHTGELHSILLDMADELRHSDFRAVDFELDLTAKENNIPLMRISGERGNLIVTGIVDRVDVWEHDGRQYLRVVDYKTGVKEFQLDDIYYGKNLQMLLYLHVLRKNGSEHYQGEILPAGIMYVPAKDPLISAAFDATDESIETERKKQIRRLGIVLDDPEVKAAWETGGNAQYMPVNKTRSKKHSNETDLSLEEIDLLEGRMSEIVCGMADRLRDGDISANPYYRSEAKTACKYCKFGTICRFVDGENGEGYRYLDDMSAEEIWAKLKR